MKTKKQMFFAVPMMAMAISMSVACTSDNEVMDDPTLQVPNEERVPRRAVMNLDGGVVPFDATTRATTNEWDDGAKIYLQFTVGSSLVDGVATYNTTTSEWTVEYYGDLTVGAETKCEAYYFENAGESSYTDVVLTEHTAAYADKAAVYMLEDSALTVVASLISMTGRIRLKGEASENYRFNGFKYYSNYNITTNSFTSSSGTFASATGDDGYSDYYYGFFPNESSKEIYFEDTNNHVTFLRTLGEQALAVGRSGYLNIPSIDNRSGWKLHTYKDITVSNVTFRMIRVLATEGSGPYSSSPHYYMGETEVTQELWKAVMGSSNNPSSFSGTNLPVENVSYNDCLTFIEKLNAKTGLTFSLPTYSQWGYAFNGACISKGYSYSGSNNVDDVAWYNGNSDNTTHSVKSKQPNEIGIYDMSGNVYEFLQGDIYAYGGSYHRDYTYCQNYSSYYVKHSYSNAYGYLGLRLCLND